MFQTEIVTACCKCGFHFRALENYLLKPIELIRTAHGVTWALVK